MKKSETMIDYWNKCVQTECSHRGDDNIIWRKVCKRLDKMLFIDEKYGFQEVITDEIYKDIWNFATVFIGIDRIYVWSLPGKKEKRRSMIW